MRIGVDETLRIAYLAKIRFTPEDLARMTRDLERILEYVDKLATLDTTGIAETYQVFSDGESLRDDCVKPGLPIEQVLQNAPKAKDCFFSVPKVIG